jgi:carbonic anhydrase/acetyltransferase-like protein (isoleucine patch superfamily)
MSVRSYSRWRRILSRIPLRLALGAVKQVALVDHRRYMRLLLPLLRRAGVTLDGAPRYIAPTVFFDDFDRVTLGERTILSSHVSLLTHDYSWTTVLSAKGELAGGDEAIVRGIRIGRNVFVGRGALLMPGTVIEDDVIVGAGSVVRGRVESGSVMIGNPARRTGTLADLYEKQGGRLEALDVRKDKVA